MRQATKEDLQTFCRKSPYSVVVLRGVSGAGKSTLARWLRDKAMQGMDPVICSADAHFVALDGIYRYDPLKLNAAHSACLFRAAEAMRAKKPVIVDNTNTTVVECAPYMDLAAAYGCPALLVTLVVSAKTGFPRNIHQVPWASVNAQEVRLRKSQTQMPVRWDAVYLPEEAL